MRIDVISRASAWSGSWLRDRYTSTGSSPHNLKEHFGLSTAQYDTHLPPARTWIPAMRESSGPIGSYFWVHHVCAYPDPDNFLRMGYDTLIRNHNGWQSPEYDRLINEARVLIRSCGAHAALPAGRRHVDRSCGRPSGALR